MLNHLKKIILFGIALVSITGFYLSVFAYILPGPYMLKYMIRDLGDAKRLEVTQEVIFYESGSLDGSEGKEIVKYIFPDTFRSDMKYKDKERIHVVSRGEDLIVHEGSIATSPSTWLDIYKDLLLYRSRRLLEEQLLFRRVSTSVVSYGRFEGNAAYVMGATSPDETKPQVWFTLDLLQPYRWILRTRNGRGFGDTLEVRYLNWKEIEENWYPMHIEFYKNNTLVKEINVKNVKVNPSFSKELFNIRRLKSVYR